METIDYSLKSVYDNEGKHLIKGFLIGTKIADNKQGVRWSVDKDTLKNLVKQFEQEQYGDIVFAPRALTGSKDDHPWGDNFEHQFQYQKQFTKAKFRKLYGPFDYEDGTDDYYYKFAGEVTDKPVSDALKVGDLPYNVSPMIYPTDKDGNVLHEELSNKLAVKYWKPAHIAIVPEGAFGPQAVIEKQCFGPEGKCFAALAASTANIDVANLISSQIYLASQNSSTMSDANTQNLGGPTENANKLPEVSYAPVKQTNTIPTIQTSESSQVSVEEFTKLQTEFAAQKKVNEKLVLGHKTDVLNKIFGSISDEAEKTKIMKRWLGAEDVDILAEFHNDILNHVVPTLKAPKAPEADKTSKNALAASADEEDCGCSKHKKEKEDKTDFPLAGSATSGSSRLNKTLSLTEMFGGVIERGATN